MPFAVSAGKSATKADPSGSSPTVAADEWRIISISVGDVGIILFRGRGLVIKQSEKGRATLDQGDVNGDGDGRRGEPKEKGAHYFTFRYGIDKRPPREILKCD
jgi:hypothetical protein